jgi:hypothetical protein
VNNVKKYILYAFGEILLIVVGILIAVQIGNWNQERKDRLEEREVLSRISNEVAGHASRISDILHQSLANTKIALEHVTSVFNGEPITDDLEFLTAVIRSGSFGYAMPKVSITAYEELVSSGKLQLIRKVELRDLISAYYLTNDDVQTRGEALKGEYGLLTFELVPRAPGGAINTTIHLMSEEIAREVVASVLKSDLRRLLIPQRNRLEFLEFLWTRQLEECTELLAEIESELEGK